jgi:PEP-CTERM motif-containing protein
MRLKAAAVLLVALALTAPTTATATPISTLFTGSVTQTFNGGIVPLGTPATILLTADPAANVIIPGPGIPPGAGAYLFNAVISFSGDQYILNGAIEVNYDPTFDVPLPGVIRLLELNVSGPPLLSGFPMFSWTPLLTCQAPFCGTPIGTTDPLSPAFPDFQTLGFNLTFRGDCGSPGCPGGGVIRVVGSNPQAVPEPASLLLMGTGMFVLQRWLKRRRSRATGRYPL